MYEIEIFDKDKRLSISPEELQNKCRICLKQNGIINIFETKENEHLYSDILSDLCLLLVDKADGMPEKVCSTCGDLISKVHTLKQKVQSSHVILQIALGQINLNSIGKPEDPELSEDFEDVPDGEKELTKNNDSSELKNLEYTCSFCLSKFKTRSLYLFHRKREDRHRRTKQSNKKFAYECGMCGVKFAYKTSLNIHNIRHKSNEIPQFTCNECGKKFFTKHNLGLHQKIHGGPPYPCKVCKKNFAKRNVLKLHMRCHSGERPYLCTVCGANFSQKGHLNTHFKLKHSDEKPFNCSDCDKKFAIKSHLDVHLRTHVKEKPYLCTVCGKMFTQDAACKAHMIAHSEETGILCNTCGQLFPTRRDLFEHIRVNHAERPCKQTKKERASRGNKICICELCDKQFDRKSSYEIHMRSHTGEKPFSCTNCGKSFKQGSHLYYHMKLHNGEKNFGCQFCDKKFTLKGNLTQHVRTHTGDRPFECDVCSKKFYTPHTLRRHKVTHLPK